MNDIRIINKSLEELIPYAMNSRTHSDSQISQIAASIKEFGFLNPVIIDNKNGIIAGHGRVMAAKKLGLDQVPTIEAGHLTDAQRKAYIIADNKIALNSDWDDQILKIELEHLTELDFDLSILGWDVLPEFSDDVNYEILEDDDVEQQMTSMTDGVKKAIQIEFELSDYDEAQEIFKFWRLRNAYIGGIIIDLLTKEKDKL